MRALGTILLAIIISVALWGLCVASATAWGVTAVVQTLLGAVQWMSGDSADLTGVQTAITLLFALAVISGGLFVASVAVPMIEAAARSMYQVIQMALATGRHLILSRDGARQH